MGRDGKLKVTIRNGDAYVTATAFRDHLTTILERVLPEHGHLTVTCNRRPVCVLQRLEDVGQEA